MLPSASRTSYTFRLGRRAGCIPAIKEMCDVRFGSITDITDGSQNVRYAVLNAVLASGLKF